MSRSLREVAMRITLLFLLGCGVSHTPNDDAGANVDAGAIETLPDAGDDAGHPIVDAGHPLSDAGCADRDGRIACGAASCTLGSEGCLASCQRGGVFEPACVAIDEGGTWPRDECPGNEEQFPRYWLRCDGPEDCPDGESCRVIHGSLGNYAYCQPCTPDTCSPEFSPAFCHDDA